MNRSLKQVFHAAMIAILLLGLTGCDESPPEYGATQHAVEIESRDECHLCGMIITHFPGPKGEAYVRNAPQVLKFCSTRDMFAYILEPEHTHNIQSVFVHDMAKSPWDAPDDEFFVDARNAWYVVGHSLTGAMGSTLASF